MLFYRSQKVIGGNRVRIFKARERIFEGGLCDYRVALSFKLRV